MLTSSDVLDLSVDLKTAVRGTVATPAPEDEGLYTSHEAHVNVTIPSRIPGRNALSLPQVEMAELKFEFDVAESRLGTPATIRFTPGSNGRGQPPIVLMSTLAPLVDLAFPRHDQLTVIAGRLQDSSGQGLPDFFVRAWSGSTLVSSLAATDNAGVFNALVPTDLLKPASPLFLTMDEADTTNGPGEMKIVPQYISLPFVPPAAGELKPDGSVGLHVYTMPAYTAPSVAIPFVVLASGTEMGLSGVTVRFRVDLPSPPDGTAVYEGSAVSGPDGVANVPLITDEQGNALSYQLFLQPPNVDDYRYASGCLPAVPISASQAIAPQPAILTMDYRPVLYGRVSGKNTGGTDGPLVGAKVVATQIFEGGACSDAVAPFPASAFTDSTGAYQLRVDPGRYRIDVIPPDSDAWPRFSEDGDAAVIVTSTIEHNISLPMGEVVDGTVKDAAGFILTNATVRIFELACKTPTCTIADPPSLLSEVRTDMAGKFRAVLPAQ